MQVYVLKHWLQYKALKWKFDIMLVSQTLYALIQKLKRKEPNDYVYLRCNLFKLAHLTESGCDVGRHITR